MELPVSIDPSNRNSLWASVIVDELAKCGLRHAVLAPGSRLTPLTLALWREPDIQVHSVLDERSAAFFALGIGKATGKPAAVVCTSGTAAANFFPAIIEASESNVPMIAMTADYPQELRLSGANQIIDQVRLYGEYVRWFADIAAPYPAPDDRSLRYLRTTVDRAVARTQGLDGGPVHLNIPFDKPLEPVAVEGDVPGEVLTGLGAQGRSGKFIRIGEQQGPQASPEALDTLRQAIAQARRGLIIAGPAAASGPAAGQWILTLSKMAGYPILVDPLSNIRFGAGEGVLIGGYETFLRGEFAKQVEPDLIIQVGGLPVSAALLDFLDQCAGIRRIVIKAGGKWADRNHTASEWIPASSLRPLAGPDFYSPPPQIDVEWGALFKEAEQTTRKETLAMEDDVFNEGSVASAVFEALPEGANLIVSNSNPIRLLDQFVAPQAKDVRIFANRGASGIDGVLSSALGAASVSEQPSVLLIGDLALYHDLNSLHLVRRLGIQLVIIVINNDGGGIFHRLPIAQYEPPFGELFQTPHGLSFEGAAQMFDLPYSLAEGTAAFQETLASALQSGEAHLIEVPSDPGLFERQRRQLNQTVAQRIAQTVTIRSRG